MEKENLKTEYLGSENSNSVHVCGELLVLKHLRGHWGHSAMGRDTQNMEGTPKGQVGRHQKTCTILSFFLNLFWLYARWIKNGQAIQLIFPMVHYRGLVKRKRLRNSLGLQWNRSGHSHVNHLFFQQTQFATPSNPVTSSIFSLSHIFLRLSCACRGSTHKHLTLCLRTKDSLWLTQTES